MMEHPAIPSAEEFLSQESIDLIEFHTFRMAQQLEQGKSLQDVLADALCYGQNAREDASMPEQYTDDLTLSENNAYFLAEYITDRVLQQIETSEHAMEDEDGCINSMLDALISDCDLDNPQELYKAVQRMHQLNEGLRAATSSLRTGTLTDAEKYIGAYPGECTLQALDKLRAQATARLGSLQLSDACLDHFAQEFLRSGDACATSEHFAANGLTLKAIIATVIFILSRSGNLPEITDQVPLDAIISYACYHVDVQIISDTVGEGQQVYDNASKLLKAAFIAALLGLLVTLILSGSVVWLLLPLCLHPMTLVLCGVLIAAAVPVILNHLADAKDRIASTVAQAAMDSRGDAVGALPSLFRAKHKLCSFLDHIVSLFCRKEELPGEEPVADVTDGVEDVDALHQTAQADQPLAFS